MSVWDLLTEPRTKGFGHFFWRERCRAGRTQGNFFGYFRFGCQFQFQFSYAYTGQFEFQFCFYFSTQTCTQA